MPSTQDLFASTLAAYQAFGPLHELTLAAQANVASASLAAAKLVSDAQASLDQAKVAQTAAQSILDKAFSALGSSIQGDEGQPPAPAHDPAPAQ